MLNSGDDDNVIPPFSPSPSPCCVFIFCPAPLSQDSGRENSRPSPFVPSPTTRREPYCVLVVVCPPPTHSTRSPPYPSVPYKMTTVLRFYDACLAQYPFLPSSLPCLMYLRGSLFLITFCPIASKHAGFAMGMGSLSSIRVALEKAQGNCACHKDLKNCHLF